MKYPFWIFDISLREECFNPRMGESPDKREIIESR
jgi:hypothetical protein